MIEVIFFDIFAQVNIKKYFLKIKYCKQIFVPIKKGILRGLHYQSKPYEETKIITCISGEIFDVAVDLRKIQGLL